MKELKHGYWWFRRSGDRLEIGWFCNEVFRPSIVIHIHGNGIYLDADWWATEQATEERIESWRSFLYKLDLPVALHNALSRGHWSFPKTLMPEGYRQYLEAITDGKIVVRNIGIKRCAQLKDALAVYDNEL